MFKDEAEIEVWGGRGGDGCVSLRREKYVPRGGPDGGDGGRGGHVILQVQNKVGSLLHLVRKKQFRARNGRPGEGKNRTGRTGEDLIIPVPLGTMVRDLSNGILLKDLSSPDQQLIVCQGGNPGRGNRSLASSINRCPRQSHPGGEGENRRLALELKLIADVGIIGLPNAGKSTLLSRLSAARPRIASYPFTTLNPQLGIVDLGNYETLVLADVPGLIEGASEGLGLGDRFLRHVERTGALLHLVDVSPTADVEPAEAYRIIRKELTKFGSSLSTKREFVVANKADLPGWKEGLESLREACGSAELLVVSTLTGKNLQKLTGRLRDFRADSEAPTGAGESEAGSVSAAPDPEGKEPGVVVFSEDGSPPRSSVQKAAEGSSCSALGIAGQDEAPGTPTQS